MLPCWGIVPARDTVLSRSGLVSPSVRKLLLVWQQRAEKVTDL